MISKMFLILCSITLVYSVNIRLYDVAGDYILTPEDYGFQDNIIIELWGAGSGSMKSNINNGDPVTYACGGNSGSFINAKIDTTNQETFYFSLGAGGDCSLCNSNTMYGKSGNYSLFYSEDKELFLNVSGGIGSKDYYCSTIPAIVNSTKHRADDIIIDYFNGTISYKTTYSIACSNGQSPFGPSIDVSYKKFGNKCDGYMGSGSGCGCCGCIIDEKQNCIRPYKGGDGALIVYY